MASIASNDALILPRRANPLRWDFRERQVFGPDEVHILVAAFDKAWETVQASGVRYPEAKAEQVRAILAKHIIAAAMNGERDLGRLRDGALLALAQSNLRSGSASLLS